MKKIEEACQVHPHNLATAKLLVCDIECTLGDEGHCGRTSHEFLWHCEMLFNTKKPQRGVAHLRSIDRPSINSENKQEINLEPAEESSTV